MTRVRLLLPLLTVVALSGAEIRVDMSRPGKKVTPGLFGIFLEEINHGGDGGIYAELVRNGSFSEAQTMDGWFPVRTGAAKLNLFFETEMPLSPAKPRSLRVEVSVSSGEKTGVANEGY